MAIILHIMTMEDCATIKFTFDMVKCFSSNPTCLHLMCGCSCVVIYILWVLFTVYPILGGNCRLVATLDLFLYQLCTARITCFHCNCIYFDLFISLFFFFIHFKILHFWRFISLNFLLHYFLIFTQWFSHTIRDILLITAITIIIAK